MEENIEDDLKEEKRTLPSDIPETLKNSVYTPAFLKQHIGKLVKVEFLIGTSYLEDRTGILLEVGASYVVLRSVQDNNLLYCDIFSIKFVTISMQSFIYGIDYSSQPGMSPIMPYNQYQPYNQYIQYPQSIPKLNNGSFSSSQINSSFM